MRIWAPVSSSVLMRSMVLFRCGRGKALKINGLLRCGQASRGAVWYHFPGKPNRSARGEDPGFTQRAVGVSRGRRAARVQAGRIRGARRGIGPRHRAGRDVAAGRALWGPARGGARAAVPAHPAERDPRLVPAPEGALDLGDAALLAFRWARGGGFRPAGNPAAGRGVKCPGTAWRPPGKSPNP